MVFRSNSMRHDQQRMEDLITGFIRAFGLTDPEHRTPCGQPISVSEAHAMLALGSGLTLNQSELASEIGLTKATVSRLVTILQERNWVERTPDGSDGRAVRLVLTPNGVRALERLRAARSAHLSRLLERVPLSERKAVLHALEVLSAAARD